MQHKGLQRALNVATEVCHGEDNVEYLNNALANQYNNQQMRSSEHTEQVGATADDNSSGVQNNATTKNNTTAIAIAQASLGKQQQWFEGQGYTATYTDWRGNQLVAQQQLRTNGYQQLPCNNIATVEISTKVRGSTERNGESSNQAAEQHQSAPAFMTVAGTQQNQRGPAIGNQHDSRQQGLAHDKTDSGR